MGKFKQVLEVEKKYESIISNAKQKYEAKLKNIEDEIRMKEELYIKDHLKDLEKEYEKETSNQNKQGEDLIKKSEEQKKFIYNNSNKSEATKFLVEVFKNV